MNIRYQQVAVVKAVALTLEFPTEGVAIISDDNRFLKHDIIVILHICQYCKYTSVWDYLVDTLM